MKLRRLHAASFAAIREVDIEFGPGLNVLYGPNDLGKSTLVAAIRLALSGVDWMMISIRLAQAVC